MSQAVTDVDFAAVVLLAEGPVLVDFWAEWCGPCRAVSPILDQIGEEHPELKVVKLNVDDYPEIAARYRITSIPAIQVFKGGEVVKKITGAKPKPALEDLLEDFLDVRG